MKRSCDRGMMDSKGYGKSVMSTVKWTSIAVALVLYGLTFCFSAVHAGSDREVLRGIAAIGVVIGELPRSAGNAGITRDSFRSAIVLKLQSAGIEVVTPEALQSNPEIPHILVTVILSYSKPTYMYAVLVGLNEKVHVKRDTKIISYAMPWWRIIQGEHVGDVGLEKEVTNTLEKLLDEFIADFRAVNPRHAVK